MCRRTGAPGCSAKIRICEDEADEKVNVLVDGPV
jgi:hypothetical protein